MLESDIQFKNAKLACDGYLLMVPEQYIGNYVTYYRDYEGKPGYADERYMKANQDFYYELKALKGWKDTIDFDEIPSSDVERLYNIYRGIPSTNKQKEAYRKAHPDLDDWLVNHAPSSIRVLPLDHVHRQNTEAAFIEDFMSREQRVRNLQSLFK
jgi:hypothetical protein